MINLVLLLIVGIYGGHPHHAVGPQRSQLGNINTGHHISYHAEK